MNSTVIVYRGYKMSIGDFSVILSLEKFSSLFPDDFSKRKIFGHDKSICQKT